MATARCSITRSSCTAAAWGTATSIATRTCHASWRGSSGGTQTGRHLRYPLNTPMSNLLLTLLDAAGVPIEKLGDSTGRPAARTAICVSSGRSLTRVPLACTVRDCGLPLQKREREYVCEYGHTFDIARSGYLNLLQPQDRRSSNAGDSKDAIAARASLLAAGVGRALVNAVAAKAAALDLPDDPVVVDLGSGSGDAIAALAERRSVVGVGIDLATAAAEHAARRFPSHTWVVANADRRLPLLDRSVHLLLSLYGRRNPEEPRACSPTKSNVDRGACAG
jgi:SAM-dependent methyltransferase